MVEGEDSVLERIRTALILVIILLPVFIFGSWPLVITVLFLAHRALYELLRMIKIRFLSIPGLLAHLSMGFIILSSKLTRFLPAHLEIHHIIALIALLMLFSATVSQSFTFIDAGIAMIGIVYIGYGFYSLYHVRESSLYLLIFIILSTAASDTGAYFVGKSIGKHKLAPTLSPNKTIEGSVGGVVVSMLVAALYITLIPVGTVSYGFGILAAGLIAVAGQFGDLIESGMKREFKVKDAGKILPGHGGILDRFDSLIFAMTLALLIGLV